MKNIIVITGPTGVGKTELCINIAEHYACDIINCDSRQIFKDIPIGTAAPTLAQQERVRHHFVGMLPLEEYFSASMYEEQVCRLVEKSEKEIFLLSGGSMMYIDAVCNGIDELPTIREDIREWMKQRLEREGIKNLVNELQRLDPRHWETVDKRNPRRILHALEICHQTSLPYSSFLNKKKQERPFNIIKIGLRRERGELYERINQRVEEMIENGFIKEARKVYHLRALNSLNTVGYKELFEYFDGEISFDEAIRKIQSNSRKYARKQETWFKRDNDITWFAPEDIEGIKTHIDNNLK